MPFSPNASAHFSQKVLGIFSFFQNHMKVWKKLYKIGPIHVFDP